MLISRSPRDNQISRVTRVIAGMILLLTAIGYLYSRLVFVPIPWPDSSAFYLPGLDLLKWPPHWTMHAQAAFIPSYDEANFNIMPALPFLLGLFGRSGLMEVVDPQLLLRMISLIGLLVWVWMLWTWVLQNLESLLDAPRARIASSLLALAALWDPILRWGTLVVRSEMWIGLWWLICLRELHCWETTQNNAAETPEGLAAKWSATAWRLSAGIAFAAYIHYESIYFVPAVIVGLGFSKGWFKRLVGIGLRTTAFLIPWLIFVGLHADLFIDQMQIQFHRLAHANYWMSNAYMTFHSLFIEHGSPATTPKFFNLAKGIFWAVLVGVTLFSGVVAVRPKNHSPRRALLASAVAFAGAFFLWFTKAEVWFVTLCHVAFWPWVGAALISASRTRAPLLARRALVGAMGALSLISLAAAFAQTRAISPDYTWSVYNSWIDCIERSFGPLDTQATIKLWQPHVPDILVELSHRHPGWDLTRALDFPARKQIAIEAGRKMDAVIFTHASNQSSTSYVGPLRDQDRALMDNTVEVPFGDWALHTLEAEEPGLRTQSVCEYGPFWAVVVARKTRAIPAI